MIDPLVLRKEFPLLDTLSHKKTFVYLDNAATTAKPHAVLEAERKYYEEYGVNIHRGLYEYSAKATRLFQETREKTARFLNAEDSRSIVFTRGSTESSNLLAVSWGRVFLKSGDRVLTTQLEHHSTLVPWQQTCKATGAELDFIPFNTETGQLDLSDLGTLLRGVKMVVLSAMTNATGYVLPVAEITRAAHAVGALVTIDAAQFAAHNHVDVQILDCDFLYFSAHKMLGPTGVGVLYGRYSLLNAMEPFLFGGDMIERVHDTYSTWAPVPEKFEAGTPNIAGVLGFSAALDYLGAIGMDDISVHEHALLNYAMDLAQRTPGMLVYGPRDRTQHGGILSFNIEGIHSHDIGTILDAQAVAVRTGFHCAMPYMDLLGVPGTVRASFYCYNTEADIDRLFDGIGQARALFG